MSKGETPRTDRIELIRLTACEPGYRVMTEHARALETENRQLREALTYCVGGLALAYNAVEKGCYDEALLHIGHHEARVNAALTPTVGGAG